MRYLSMPRLGGAALLATGVFGAPALHAQDTCDTAGLELPDGFCATAFATDVDAPRHIAVADDGTVYTNLADAGSNGGLMALRDTDGDGTVDERATFGQGGGTGILVNDGWLYAATVTDIYRYKLSDALVPEGEPEHIVADMPEQTSHSARGLAISGDTLFVNNGAPSNACQEQDRVPGSMGQDPCPQLENHGGIWAFSASETGQRFSPDARFATGLRNTFALATRDDQLYGVQHGRDQLHSNWSEQFTQRQSAHLPSEELFAIDEGDHFGWPFCYHDPEMNEKVLAPEYGGDGETVGRCDQYEMPIAAYPAHWAPMAMVFYNEDSFPAEYDGGAFIAFHGSWNRAPSPQAGYNVIFQPFSDGEATDDWQEFATAAGFTGQDTIQSPGNADHRPAGLAVGADGALYISDDAGGTIFRVTHGDG